MIRGYAWSGAGAITQVEVSVDNGQTWQAAHLEPPRDRFMWVQVVPQVGSHGERRLHHHVPRHG